MKSTILSLILSFGVMAGSANNTYAASSANAEYTILNNIAAINKIEVHGNVELFISDNDAQTVKVYNKYYAESALVQNKNGVLRISSYSPEKLVVWVNSANLNAISAYDNAEVRSFGNVSKIEFSIELHDNATANLSLNSYRADVTLLDQAKIELDGSVSEFNLSRSAASIIVKHDLMVFDANSSNTITETSKKDLAHLE